MLEVRLQRLPYKQRFRSLDIAVIPISRTEFIFESALLSFDTINVTAKVKIKVIIIKISLTD